MGLKHDGDGIVPLAGYDGYGAFYALDGSMFDSKTNVRFNNHHSPAAYGVICHQSCIDLLRTHPRTAPVPTSALLYRKVGFSGALKDCTRRYRDSGIGRYHSQVFDVEALMEDGNGWLLQDPMDPNSRNGKRILNMWLDLLDRPPRSWRPPTF
jgi:hypothetical protein